MMRFTQDEQIAIMGISAIVLLCVLVWQLIGACAVGPNKQIDLTSHETAPERED